MRPTMPRKPPQYMTDAEILIHIPSCAARHGGSCSCGVTPRPSLSPEPDALTMPQLSITETLAILKRCRDKLWSYNRSPQGPEEQRRYDAAHACNDAIDQLSLAHVQAITTPQPPATPSLRAFAEMVRDYSPLPTWLRQDAEKALNAAHDLDALRLHAELAENPECITIGGALVVKHDEYLAALPPQMAENLKRSLLSALDVEAAKRGWVKP